MELTVMFMKENIGNKDQVRISLILLISYDFKYKSNQ
jgi:hypothetical protein